MEKLSFLSTVATVSGHDSISWNEYPAGALTILEGEGEFASTHHNVRRRRFSFKVYIDATSWDLKQAEEISISALDEIEEALDRDTTLSGAVKYVAPVAWDARSEVREFDVRVLDLTIEAVELTQTNF